MSDLLEFYFKVCKIKEDEKVDHLILRLTPERFQILKNHLAPNAVKDSSFTECVQNLKEHFSPATSVIAETFKFHSHKQIQGEKLSDFIAELKNVSLKCDFGTHRDRGLRDKLVISLNDSRISNF